MQSPAQLFEKPITLLHVVTSARRDDVGPVVGTTATTRYDVVDRVGVFETVRASVTVAQEK